MEEKPLLSIEEFEEIKEYFNQKGSNMEEMLEEYQMCITSLLDNGIPAGEVHDAMEIFLESTKLLNHKFQMLSTTTEEVVAEMQNVVNESDNAILGERDEKFFTGTTGISVVKHADGYELV